jgi:hypothetical protein
MIEIGEQRRERLFRNELVPIPHEVMIPNQVCYIMSVEDLGDGVRLELGNQLPSKNRPLEQLAFSKFFNMAPFSISSATGFDVVVERNLNTLTLDRFQNHVHTHLVKATHHMGCGVILHAGEETIAIGLERVELRRVIGGGHNTINGITALCHYHYRPDTGMWHPDPDSLTLNEDVSWALFLIDRPAFWL